MRWIAILAAFLVLTGSSRAAGPDDQYLDVYNGILQGDNLQQNGHSREAAEKYIAAQTALKMLKHEHPDWNVAVVDFRLDYLSDKLQGLAAFIPAAPVAPKIQTPPQVAAPAQGPTETALLQEQVRSLTAANAQLENKLKEALSIQPAAVSPAELAKAQEKIIALQKEKDLLAVALGQAKAAKPSPETGRTAQELADAKKSLADLTEQSKAAQAETDRLKNSLDDAQKKLLAADAEIQSLKSAPAPAASDSVKELAAERDKLKDDLAARTKDLADAESHREPGVADLRAKLAQAELERDVLKAKLASAAPAPSSTDAQTEQLGARLAVLEASPVPYTPEELAIMKKGASPVPAPVPAPAAEHKHIVHSMKDLPPGAGALMTEAARAEMERDYPKAVEKYGEILRQDENNVYVMAHLARVQFAMNQTAECEKTVTRALALDPEDPACLYLLGILRYRQEKLDDALNALSLSAKYNPTNAGTENYLGMVLADKGQRTAAETAFRKALAADPSYPDAHFNLAFIYAEQKPPSLELARWHYKRALDLGHAKSPELEKLLGPSP